MSNLAALSFNNTNLEIVDRNGQQWMQGVQIAKALGYKRSDAVAKIYDRNSDEFTSEMSAIIETPNMGLTVKQRIFSLRGAHLIGMFARTGEAKSFRKWVLDIIGCETKQPAIPSTITPEQQRTIQEKVSALAVENKAYAKYYGAIKTHFKIAKYDQLQASDFAEALEVLQGVVVEPKAIKQEVAISKPILRNRQFIYSYDSSGVESIDEMLGDKMLVSRMNFDALKNRVNLTYKRHQEMDTVKIDIELTQAALENVKRDIDKYIYRTNDAVREANLIADAMKH